MTSVITAKGLEVHFRGCDALCGVDLDVQPGTVFALLGENGAGKTTLIRVLTGFLAPSSGSCTVLGMDPLAQAQEIRKRIGYVSDSPALYDWMRVDEIGWFAASFYSSDFLERYRESISRYEVPASRKIKHLSKGQRAKVALALALGHDPELLVLDEPTSGLDPLVRREFLESMLDRVATGRTVLLSSHQIAEVERVADEVAILHDGKFCIQESLSVLRDTVHEITVNLEDHLTEIPQFEPPVQVLREQCEGRQYRKWIVRDFDDACQAMLQSRPGVSNIRSRSATLDEVFAACTRGRLGEDKRGARSSDQRKVAGVA